MLRWRLLSAAVIIGLALGFIYLDFQHPFGKASGVPATGVWLSGILMAFAILGTNELLHILWQGDIRTHRAGTYFGMTLITVASCIPMFWPLSGSPYPADCPLGKLGWPLGAALVGLLILAVIEMRDFKPGQTITRLSGGAFVFLYLGMNLAFWVALRLYHDHYWGMAAVMSMIVVVKLSDTGAYFVGRALGRNKLAPKVSPGKSIEGAIGGLLSGVGATFLFFFFIIDWMVEDPVRPSVGACLVYGLTITVTGMLGDLFESLLKRDVKVKDSSGWLPGLGGVLDTVDSILVAAPIAYLCWAAGMLGPPS